MVSSLSHTIHLSNVRFLQISCIDSCRVEHRRGWLLLLPHIRPTITRSHNDISFKDFLFFCVRLDVQFDAGGFCFLF